MEEILPAKAVDLLSISVEAYQTVGAVHVMDDAELAGILAIGKLNDHLMGKILYFCSLKRK